MSSASRRGHTGIFHQGGVVQFLSCPKNISRRDVFLPEKASFIGLIQLFAKCTAKNSFNITRLALYTKNSHLQYWGVVPQNRIEDPRVVKGTQVSGSVIHRNNRYSQSLQHRYAHTKHADHINLTLLPQAFSGRVNGTSVISKGATGQRHLHANCTPVLDQHNKLLGLPRKPRKALRCL